MTPILFNTTISSNKNVYEMTKHIFGSRKPSIVNNMTEIEAALAKDNHIPTLVIATSRAVFMKTAYQHVALGAALREEMPALAVNTLMYLSNEIYIFDVEEFESKIIKYPNLKK